MPHRLPLHVQAQRLPLVSSDPIVQPYHDLVTHSSLMLELDRIAVSLGGPAARRSTARVLRCPPIVG